MLIFEGPDNSGKSTIASYVSYQLEIPLHHFGKPPKTVQELRTRVEFMFDNKDSFIFDRIPLISEQVYSILRPQNLMSVLDEANSYYVRLKELNPVLIYCRPPIENMIERLHLAKSHDSEEHMEAVEKRQIDLVDRYDQVMESEYLPPCWWFDYTTQEHDVILETIENAIIKRNHYKSFYNEVERVNA